MKEILLYNVISNDSFFGMGEQGLIDRVVNEIKDAKDEDILLRLSTPGGSIFQGQTIIRNLQEHEGQVNIIVDGLAASMGGVMLAFADNVVADKYSRIMLHKGYGGDGSEDSNNLIDSLNNQFADMFKNRGVDSDLIDQIFLGKDNKDYWFTAEEALVIGLIDEVSSLDTSQKLVAYKNNLIDEYYSRMGNIENKIIYNNNNEEDMGLFDKKEKEELEKQISDLTESVTNLTNANSDLNDSKANLEKEINDLNEAKTEEETKAENESVEIKAQFDDLKKENTELKDSLESNISAVTELGEKHDALLAQIKKTVTGFTVEETQNGEDGKNVSENYGRAARIRNKIEENK